MNGVRTQAKDKALMDANALARLKRLARKSTLLATLVSKPFDKPGWVYEEKYDGYRIFAYKEGAEVTLVSRNDNDRTQAYAEIAVAVAALPARMLLLDGEVVAFDRHKVSRFQLLQQGRSAQYAVFDCLYKDGTDLRSKPLLERRKVLEAVIGDHSNLFVSRRLAANGLEAYRVAKHRGFEGIVAKDNSAPYTEGRSTKWLKVKIHQEEEFVVAGFTAPEGTRQYLGALILGAYDAQNRLHYVGKVGTGFTRSTLASLSRVLKPLVQKDSPLVDPSPRAWAHVRKAQAGCADRIPRMDCRWQAPPACVPRVAQRQEAAGVPPAQGISAFVKFRWHTGQVPLKRQAP
jgi:bifunctional non-homologous end joining protein LigD